MRSRVIQVALCAAVVLALVGCQDISPAPPTFLTARAECPHAWIWPADSTQYHAGLHNALIGNVSLVRDIINVPEFHDCQRFIARESGALVYRKFFAIWASSRLARMITDLADPTAMRLDTVGFSPPSPGDTVLDLQARPEVVPPDSSAYAVAVAEIYAEEAYAPLGIAPWLNCLYLYRRNQRWEARMIPMGNVNVSCDRIASGTTIPAGTDLQVIATSFPEFPKETDYPAVARWDWDAANEQQYLGIKCGAAWCEVGSQSLRPSAPIPVNASDPRGLKRVRMIKGWYDQQYLAKELPGKVEPSGILGTIIPDTLLGQRNQVADFASFVHAADVVLVKGTAADSAALGKYRQKLGFTESTFAAPNSMLLCNGPGCTPAGGETPVNCAPGVDWRARVVPPAAASPQPSVLKCVRRRNATDYFVAGPSAVPGAMPPVILVPGTARWRWLPRDEGTWVRCTEGCCDTQV